MVHFKNELPCSSQHATSLPYPSSSLPKQAVDFVLSLPASTDRALIDAISTNTWQALSRRSLPESTAHPRAYPLASDRTPHSQTLWRSTASFSRRFTYVPYAARSDQWLRSAASARCLPPLPPVSRDPRTRLSSLPTPHSPIYLKHASDRSPADRRFSSIASDREQTRPPPRHEHDADLLSASHTLTFVDSSFCYPIPALNLSLFLAQNPLTGAL
jgi:hypothetical protein